MKFTKTHEKQLLEFMKLMDHNGCVPVTEWTSGSGRYTKPRALPPFVKRYEREHMSPYVPKHGTQDFGAYAFFRSNPRRKSVLVLDIDTCFAFLFDSANCREMI